MIRKIDEMPKVTGVSNITGPGAFHYGQTQMVPYVRVDLIVDLLEDIDRHIAANTIRAIEDEVQRFRANLAAEGV